MDYKNHILSTQYEASSEDFVSIQLYLLFIGNQAIFLITYVISILAAAYGVTKFFILSRAGVLRDKDDRTDKCGVVITFLINCTYIVVKGAVLAYFVLVWENSMYHNVLSWVAYCMLPSFILSLIVIFGSTFYKTEYKICGDFPPYSNYSISLLLEEPPMMIVPVVSPFVFKPRITNRSNRPFVIKEIQLENGEGSYKQVMDGTVCEKTGQKKPYLLEDINTKFKINKWLTLLNHVITVSCAAAGLILEAQQPLEVVVPVAVCVLIVTSMMGVGCFKTCSVFEDDDDD